MSISINTIPSEHHLFLITRPSLQTSALIHIISKSLPLNIQFYNIKENDNILFPSNSLILFDIMVSIPTINIAWQTIFQAQQNNIKLLLINIDETYHFQELHQWPNIAAIFYPHEEQNKMIRGINAVLQGECYLPQKIANALFCSNVKPYHNTSSDRLLTERELEIVAELTQGASNTDIARSLYISEHTVRTHLYNIFKKLYVKNRIQLVNWANKNLPRYEYVD